MAFIPVPNVAQVEVRMTLDSQRIENTLYFEKAAPWGIVQLQALTADIRAWWIALVAPLVSASVALNTVFARDLTFANSTQAEVSGGVSGTRGGPVLPSNVSLCVSFRTGQTGRSFRGRNYIVGLTEGDVIGNLVDDPLVQSYIDAYLGLLPIATENASEWVVVSRHTNGSPRVSGIGTPITSVVVVDRVVDSQRRRLPGRGQ